MTQALINHIALLVPSVEKAADYLQPFGFKIGPAEQWEGEGTLEIYVGDTKSERATLLLMEPVKEGAYTRAMKKRGPGLHHIAIDVLNLDSYIDGLSSSGWLLHPRSLHTMKETRTAYLARPGMPTLIELQERPELKEFPYFIEGLSIPNLSEKSQNMFKALGLNCVATDCSELKMQIRGKQIYFGDLV